MNNNILTIKNLSKVYHSLTDETLALEDISFEVKEREIVAIVGASGSGKSTILSIIAELINYSKGCILKKPNLSIGYMLQTDSLFPWLTVYENCLLGLKITKRLTNEKKKEVIELLKKYQLIDFKDKYPKELSGGMKQRVAIIRTIVTDPDLLLLDEPFSALDFQTRIMIGDDIYKLIRERKKSAVIVTHDILEAISLADKVIVISKRPAKIKKIFKIKRPSDDVIAFRNSNEIREYYDLIWQELLDERT